MGYAACGLAADQADREGIYRTNTGAPKRSSPSFSATPWRHSHPNKLELADPAGAADFIAKPSLQCRNEQCMA